MFGFFKKRSPEPTVDQIVARIKHTNFLATVHEMMASDPGSLPVTQPFVADLLITYAFDLPHAFQMFAERDRQRLGLSLEQLRSKAVENLRKRLPPLQKSGQPPVVMLSVGGDLEACLLLMDDLWDKICANVPGKLVVAVPTRDIVLFTSSESDLGLQVIREAVAEALKNEPVHGLTESLLVWERRQWQVFDALAAE